MPIDGSRQSIEKSTNTVINSRGLNIATTILGVSFLVWSAVSLFFAMFMGQRSSPLAIIVIGAVGIWTTSGGIENMKARKANGSQQTVAFIAKCGHVLAWLFFLAIFVCVVALAVWGITGSYLAERTVAVAGAAVAYSSLLAIIAVLGFGIVFAIRKTMVSLKRNA